MWRIKYKPMIPGVSRSLARDVQVQLQNTITMLTLGTGGQLGDYL